LATGTFTPTASAAHLRASLQQASTLLQCITISIISTSPISHADKVKKGSFIWAAVQAGFQNQVE